MLPRLSLFFWHASYIIYRIHVRHVAMYHVQRKSLVIGRHTIFLGFFHISTRAIHSSLLVDLTGEVFVTKCSGKGSKKSFFRLCRCWRTADFIISRQPFLTTASFVSMLNFAYSDGRTYIRNITCNKWISFKAYMTRSYRKKIWKEQI